MEIQDLKGKLTNKIINIGSERLLDNEFCIGATFLKSVLESHGIDYSCVTWRNRCGDVVIYNKLYHVDAYYKGELYPIMSSYSTILNLLFPKTIKLKFQLLN